MLRHNVKNADHLKRRLDDQSRESGGRNLPLVDRGENNNRIGNKREKAGDHDERYSETSLQPSIDLTGSENIEDYRIHRLDAFFLLLIRCRLRTRVRIILWRRVAQRSCRPRKYRS